MNTATQVDSMMSEWKTEEHSKSEFVVLVAKACMGWPYIFGDRGQYCTSSHRQAVYNSHPDQEGLITKCQILSGKAGSCIGCKFFPGGKTRAFDCRGFTYWCCLQAGVTIKGVGATDQWNKDENWSEKGEIANIPRDKVCCVFKYRDGRMQHTGLHIGGGQIIHCSNGVQTGNVTDKGWTHYAIPVGLDGTVPEPTPVKPTLRKGSQGPEVVELQNDLVKLGYSVGASGSDGKFGANTEKGVKAFQRDHALNADGIVGPATWDAIEKALEPLPPPVVEEYTVIIQHLDLTQATALCNAYPNASMKKE